MSNSRLAALFIMLGIFSCKQAPPTMEERLEKLGRDLVLYSRSGGMEEAFPKEVVFVGVNTFWELFQITDPIDSIDFMVYDGSVRDDEADYLLDIGYRLGLRIRYDHYCDEFHIMGYTGTVTEKPKEYQDALWKLHQTYPQDSIAVPCHGFGQILIGQTTKTELFQHYSDDIHRYFGLDFTFSNLGVLENIYVFRFALKTTTGIGTRSSNIKNVCNAYGDPDSTSTTFNLNGRLVYDVEMMHYPGISFVFDRNELMVIEVNPCE